MSEITSLQTVIKDLQTQVAALTADLAMQIAALKDASKALTERQAEVAALEEFVEVVRRTQGQALKREVERVATLEAALNKYSEDEILLTQQQRIEELESALNDVLYSGDMSECKDKALAALKQHAPE